MGNGYTPVILTQTSGSRGYDERRGTDRRAQDPRWRRLDPMFAATLVNHVARPEAASAQGYNLPQRGPRSGIIFNLKA